MKRHNPKRGFDCVAFKREVQAEIYPEIKGLSAEQEIEYFRAWAGKGPLGKWWKALERRRRRTTDPDAARRETMGRQLATH